MLAAAEELCKPAARELWKEADQLHRIFAEIVRKMQRRIAEAES